MAFGWVAAASVLSSLGAFLFGLDIGGFGRTKGAWHPNKALSGFPLSDLIQITII